MTKPTKYHKSSGIASIVITITLSLAVVAIITAFTLISVNELQQASDTSLSATALTTARSGVEQLVRQINENADYEQRSCNSPTATADPEQSISDPAGGGVDTAITCGTVTDQGTQANFRLQRDQSITFDLSDAQFTTSSLAKVAGKYAGVSFMSMFWNIPNTDSLLYKGTDPIANPSYIDFPPLTQAGSSRVEPAAVELTFSWCPKLTTDNSINSTYCNYSSGPGNFLQNASDFGTGDAGGNRTFTTLVSPWTTKNTTLAGPPAMTNKDSKTDVNGEITSGVSSDCRQASQNYFGPEACHLPQFATNAPPNPAAGCSLSDTNRVCQGSMSLSQVFPLSAGINSATQMEGYNLKVKITARYGAANFRIGFGGGLVDTPPTTLPRPTWFKFPFAQIDVTARAGQIYRHVQATKPIAFNNMLSYGLFSGANICKGLSYNDTSVLLTGNNVSCNEAP